MADLRNLGNSPSTKGNSPVEKAMEALWVNEDGLRRAGVRSYFIEVKSCSQNKWNTVYEKKVDLTDNKTAK